MKVYKLTDFADRLWNIKGSFGEFDAEVKCDGDTFYAENGCISIYDVTFDTKITEIRNFYD